MDARLETVKQEKPDRTSNQKLVRYFIQKLTCILTFFSSPSLSTKTQNTTLEHYTNLEIKVYKPRQRVLIHRLNVCQVRYGKEQDTGVLSHLIINNI